MLSSEFLSYKCDSENGGCHVGRGEQGVWRVVHGLFHMRFFLSGTSKRCCFWSSYFDEPPNLPTSELGFNVFYAPHSSKEKWSDENTCHPIKEHTKFTPLKNNMELKNHPNDKEHHLFNLHFWVPAVNFPGCTFFEWRFSWKSRISRVWFPIGPWMMVNPEPVLILKNGFFVGCLSTTIGWTMITMMSQFFWDFSSNPNRTNTTPTSAATCTVGKEQGQWQSPLIFGLFDAALGLNQANWALASDGGITKNHHWDPY